MKTAYFSLGCFWSPQLEFEKINGVKRAEVGYCGGNAPNTTYERVCSGSTNHAETVKLEFDENFATIALNLLSLSSKYGIKDLGKSIVDCMEYTFFYKKLIEGVEG